MQHFARDPRITSTYVENTVKSLAVSSLIWDHLHMCGEYLYAVHVSHTRTGSPPHVWRILYSHWCCGLSNRITSTCVENTVADVLHTTTDQDHLHMCGEYLVSWIKGQAARGSPPHVWRIHKRWWIYLIAIRITSTCVENTSTVNI